MKKALELVADPKKNNKAITYGAAKYVKNLKFDKDTGEVLEGSKRPYFDSDKMAEEEKYDGYYAIVWIVYISLPRHHSYAYYFADLIREGIKA